MLRDDLFDSIKNGINKLKMIDIELNYFESIILLYIEDKIFSTCYLSFTTSVTYGKVNLRLYQLERHNHP